MNAGADDSKFTWGDAVTIKSSAPQQYRPGQFASVCGIDKVSSLKEAEELFCSNGERVYLVEYTDGNSIEVPESYLDKYQTERLTLGV